LFEGGSQMKIFDAYSKLRQARRLQKLEDLLYECEVEGYTDKRRGELKRLCRFLFHQNVFEDAIKSLKGAK
jgi:hypothetical protein